VWIHESLEDEARRLWGERERPGSPYLPLAFL
jgi:hypothetical protein